MLRSLKSASPGEGGGSEDLRQALEVNESLEERVKQLEGQLGRLRQ